MKLRFTLVFALLTLCGLPLCAQYSYTKTFNCIPMGEKLYGFVPYSNGFLVTSAQTGGTLPLEHTVRKVTATDSVVCSIRFTDDFRNHINVVPATNGNIFVMGVASNSSSTEVNYVIMDSAFNVLHKKKLLVPYPIIICKFFKAQDGGVIGVVHEVCDESRIFRLDANGDLVWVKSYVGMFNNMYDRTLVSSIFMTASGNYLFTGHLGFGFGIFYFTIDSQGEILNSKVVELFPNDFYTDAMWLSAFDGEKVVSIVDNATNGQDTTYIIEVDTALNILNAKRLLFNDSMANSSALFAAGDEFICAMYIGREPPFPNPRVVVMGLDKTTLQPTWSFGTKHNNSPVQGILSSYFLGCADPYGVPVFAYDYGALDMSNNGGNNYNKLGFTKLDTISHDGFCDRSVEPVTAVTIPTYPSGYYIDTIPHPVCSVVNYNHTTMTTTLYQPVLVCSFTVGMEEHDAMGTVGAYPNPTSGIARLEDFYNVTVFALNGQEVMAAGYTNTIDLSGAAPGMYLVVLRDAEGRIVRREKVVKE